MRWNIKLGCGREACSVQQRQLETLDWGYLSRPAIPIRPTGSMKLYQLLPTARNTLFPFYNLMNNEDLFSVIQPQEPWPSGGLHSLGLHERNDLWYAGAGPTQGGTIFGYIGRPSNNFDDLARVIEVAPAYNFSKYRRRISIMDTFWRRRHKEHLRRRRKRRFSTWK